MNAPAAFRVSIWGPFTTNASVLFVQEDSQTGSGPTVKEITEGSGRLHTELFGWPMLEDAFAGVTDSEARAKLQRSLNESLAVQLTPRERSLDALRAIVDEAEALLETGYVEWSASQAGPTDEEERRLNPLLALTTHLKWLIAVFEGTPGISVSIR